MHDSSTFDASAVTQLDEFLEEVCSAVDLDIMPGQTDPAQVQLPQQRMHPAMLDNLISYPPFIVYPTLIGVR